jgi:cytochrome P450
MGIGLHLGIGNHFAMLEAHLILAMLVQRVIFEWTLGFDLGLIQGIR